MAYIDCPTCGLTTLTFARWSTVDACPCCDASIRRTNPAAEELEPDNNGGRADSAALHGDRRSRLSESRCQVRSDHARGEQCLDSEQPQ